MNDRAITPPTPMTPFAATVPPADNPLLDYLGIRLASVGDGHCVFELDLEPRHLNRQGSVQGGVIATMLDAACGYAGLPVGPDGALGHAATRVAVASQNLCRRGRVRPRDGHVARPARPAVY